MNESKHTPKDSWHQDQFGHIYESFNPSKSEGEGYTERHIATLSPTAKPGEGSLIAAAPELLTYAKKVMQALEQHGPSIVPHLMDNDDNDGERLRAAIAKAEGNS